MNQEQIKSPETDNNYADLLPGGTFGRIAEEINKTLAESVSVKTVERVVKGISPDKYGILPIAARIAKEHHDALKTLAELKKSA